MLRLTPSCFSRRFQYNLKYPALVSYNKLPWEVINPETPALHMHVAPHYEQLLTLAAAAPVPHFVRATHMDILAEHRLRVLPGTIYAVGGDAVPTGFSATRVEDPTALQYYGRLSLAVAPVRCVRICFSDDLRLLCNCVTMRGPPALAVAPQSSLAALPETFSIYHFFRPNRPPGELQLEKYHTHVPRAGALAEFAAGAAEEWEPRLQLPKRKEKRATPLPPYRPPQSYLMGLSERLGVVPGSAFGRRSLMWGNWF